MTKKDLIISAYNKAQGKKSYKSITNELITDGVKVTYQYVSMVLHDYTLNQKKSNIDNQEKSENIKEITIIDIYEKINDIYEKINMIFEKINMTDPCDTRTHARAGLKTSIDDNIQEKENKNITSTSYTPGLYTYMENNKGLTDEKEKYNFGYDDEVATDAVPQEENKNNLGGYDDIEPATDGIRPTTQGEKRKEKRNYESVDAPQGESPNTPKDERKRYWDSWNAFKGKFPDLSDEEREHYFKMYTKKAEKIYAGDRLGEIRDNLLRQYNYLSSRVATANDTPKQPKDDQWKPDPSTYIKIQDKELGVEGAIQLYMQQLANLIYCNPLTKDADERVRYFEYYYDRISKYADANLPKDRANTIMVATMKANFKTQEDKNEKQAV